uniref:Uncharacterized protein n=1 Tax=Caldimicrobium thiodismutans TaxID=1653476 RepID=A0A832LV07_9BACT
MAKSKTAYLSVRNFLVISISPAAMKDASAIGYPRIKAKNSLKEMRRSFLNRPLWSLKSHIKGW